MLRYSGLPNNAKLEVVTSSHNQSRKGICTLYLIIVPHNSYTEQPVRVAVQLESGDRLQGVFPPTVSLWDLMCSIHGNNKWTTGDAVVVYMRREVKWVWLVAHVIK